MGLYEASAKLTDVGVISGVDLTPEAAVTKLMYLLGKNLPIQEVKRLMQIDMCGEQTISQYDFITEEFKEIFSNSFEYELEIPTTLKKEDLIEAVVRIKNIDKRENYSDDLNISITIEGENSISTEQLKINNVINKLLPNNKKNFHAIFNHTIKSIIDKNSILKIKIQSNMKISMEAIKFSIFSEYLR